jgi:hypothetical protein
MPEGAVASFWPWLVVAALGALHGANPASGWLFAATWQRADDRPLPLRHALGCLALGHVASVVCVAVAMAAGIAVDRLRGQLATGCLLVGLAAWRAWRGADRRQPACRRTSRSAAGLAMAIASFLMATAHGTGLMLVPALVPLCLADAPARAITASGSLGLAVAAVGVHLMAMLLASAALTAAWRQGLARHVRRWHRALADHVGTAALGACGLALIAQRA